ncbi:hypothetical protein H2200_010038 [Cladophialophora chaetospira]|uniref:PH domain-containing protein n=1 Tax=Cladophialophora chaetospira TaxID=386627 RepID=A0AA38X223_9EURO|nr:hypothetical protein H2200_010038 [Cladophialophora chaetospira]
MNTDVQNVPAQPTQTQKFMRYRSVRKSAANVSEPHTSSPPPLPEAPQTSLTRVPSRYHRRPPVTQSAPLPKVPQLPSHLDHATVSRTRGQTIGGKVVENQVQSRDNGGRTIVIPHSSSQSGTRQTTSKSTSRRTPTSSWGVPEPVGFRRSYEVAREEARLILEGEHDRLSVLRQQEAKRRRQELERRRQEEEKAAEEARQREAELLAEREAAEARRREAKLEAAQKRRKPFRNRDADVQEHHTGPTLGSEPEQENKRSKMRTLVIGGPSLSKQDKNGHHRRASSAVEQVQAKPKERHGRTNSANRIDDIPEIETATTKANFDVPVSAVNAGERRVSVKCKEAFITLPVTPSTTATDILNSAALCMSEHIDPRTAILLESFSQLGLERPLRRYEHIRDVMNSWDNDAQDHLFIMAGSECAAPRLQIADAPDQQPFEITVQMYHSQKPGKWDKRWLKLREDGQISTSKNENGTDSTNICHVSDFDLYTPTTKQMKKLRPPKKICYAFKSQEKTAMFLDGASFVHFFCTKDKDIADRWYRAVHSWRSWYLVNMLGEGQRRPAEPALGLQLGNRPGTSNSRETLPYVLGSFKPLLDFGSFEPGRPSQSDNQRPLIDFVPARPSMDARPESPKLATIPQGAPPTAFPRKFMLEAATSGHGNDADGPFTGTGLLARSASRRTQGGSRTGHGVADGKPLLDLAPTSEFTDGSLLRRMETIAEKTPAPNKSDKHFSSQAYDSSYYREWDQRCTQQHNAKGVVLAEPLTLVVTSVGCVLGPAPSTDPISALSLACNVLQLVEQAIEAAKLCKDLYQRGSLDENNSIEEYADRIGAANNDLDAVLKRRALAPTTRTTRLDKICDESTKAAAALKLELNKLKLSKKQGIGQLGRAFTMTLRTIWKKGTIERLQHQLEAQEAALRAGLVKEL